MKMTHRTLDQPPDPAQLSDDYRQAQAELAELQQRYRLVHGWLHAEGTGDPDEREREWQVRQQERSLARQIQEKQRIAAHLCSRLPRTRLAANSAVEK